MANKDQIVQPKVLWWNPLSWIGFWWPDKGANAKDVDNPVEHEEKKEEEEEQAPAPAKASWWGRALSFLGIGFWWPDKGANAKDVDNPVEHEEKKEEEKGEEKGEEKIEEEKEEKKEEKKEESPSGTATKRQPFTSDDLKAAIDENNLKMVQEIINSNYKLLDSRISNCLNPLFYIIQTYDLQARQTIIALLVSKYKGIILHREVLTTLPDALEKAVQCNKMQIVQYLVAEGANITSFSLMAAAAQGKDEIMNYLLAQNIHTKELNAALRQAAYDGYSDLIKKLLDKGADVNSQGLNGRTALHNAALKNQGGVMEMLVLEYKANMQTQDQDGDTALEMMQKRQEQEGKEEGEITPNPTTQTIALLKSLEGNVQSKAHSAGQTENLGSAGKKGDKQPLPQKKNVTTKLHEAVKYQYPGNVTKIITHQQNKHDINAQDENGDTALHIVLENAGVLYEKYEFQKDTLSLDMLEILLSVQELDITIPNNQKKTPLHIAAQKGHVVFIQWVVGNNKSSVNYINAQDEDGNTALHKAADNRDFNFVNELLKIEGIDIKAKNHNNDTILHILAEKTGRNGLIHAMQVIVDCISDEKDRVEYINAKNKQGKTFLHIAAEHLGDAEMIELLKIEGIDITVQYPNGDTVLHTAVVNDKVALINLLAATNEKRNEDSIDLLNIQNNEGNTALHLAADNGELDSMRALLENKLDLNIPNNNGDTAFHMVQNIEQFKLLLDSGARWDIENKQGVSIKKIISGEFKGYYKFDINQAYHEWPSLNAVSQDANGIALGKLFSDPVDSTLAVEKQQELGSGAQAMVANQEPSATPLLSCEERFKSLKQAIDEGDLDLVKQYWDDACDNPNSNEFPMPYTPLAYAISKGQMGIVQFLAREKKCQIDTTTLVPQGYYPLWNLMKNESTVFSLDQRKEVIEIFCETGFNLRESPVLCIAAQFGDEEIIKYLLEEKHLDPNTQDEHGDTALSTASYWGNLEIVKILLKTSGIEVNAQDYHGETPLHCAVYKKHFEIAKLLLEKGADTKILSNSIRTPIAHLKESFAPLFEKQLKEKERHYDDNQEEITRLSESSSESQQKVEALRQKNIQLAQEILNLKAQYKKDCKDLQKFEELFNNYNHASVEGAVEPEEPKGQDAVDHKLPDPSPKIPDASKQVVAAQVLTPPFTTFDAVLPAQTYDPHPSESTAMMGKHSFEKIGY